MRIFVVVEEPAVLANHKAAEALNKLPFFKLIYLLLKTLKRFLRIKWNRYC